MSERAPTSELPLFAPPEPNPELAEKERALEELEASELRARYLERIREQMRILWKGRFRFLQRRSHVPDARRWPCYPKVVVTPDDAREVFEAMDPPDPDELSRNFLAGVFQTSEWKPIDTYKSQTEGSHANQLKAYRLVGGTDG